jgi:hypothetical protein
MKTTEQKGMIIEVLWRYSSDKGSDSALIKFDDAPNIADEILSELASLEIESIESLESSKAAKLSAKEILGKNFEYLNIIFPDDLQLPIILKSMEEFASQSQITDEDIEKAFPTEIEVVSKLIKFPRGVLTAFALRDQNVLIQEGAKAYRDGKIKSKEDKEFINPLKKYNSYRIEKGKDDF